MLRGGFRGGLTMGSMPAASARTGQSQLLSGIMPAGGPALEKLKQEADRLVERQQVSQRETEELRVKLEERKVECGRLEELLSQTRDEKMVLQSSSKEGERRVQSAHEKMKTVEDMHGILKGRIVSTHTSVDAAENDRLALSKSFDARFKSSEDIECRMVALKKKHMQLADEITAVRKALEDSNNDKNNLQAHLQTLQTELQEKTAKLDELSSEREALVQKLQRDTAAFEQRLEHLGTQLKQKQSELEDAASAYSLLQKQSAASCNELNASLQTAEQRVAALQTDAEAATLQHEADELDKAEAQKDVETKQKAIETAQQHLSDTQQELQVLSAKMVKDGKVHEGQVEKLRGQKDELETNLAAVSSKLKQLDIELKASRAALHEAKEQGASAVAAAELEVKRAEGAAESKIDDYKDRVAKEMNYAKLMAQKDVDWLKQKVADVEKASANRAAEAEAAHAAVFKALQDSSSAEKEQLQKEASEARAAVEQHLKSLEQAQAAATADAKTLDDKIAALTAELEAAKASHEAEAARIKSEADAAQTKALEELRGEGERRLSDTVAELARAHDKLTDATTHTTGLQEALEVMRDKLQDGETQTQAVEQALAETKGELTEKENLLAQISMAAHRATDGGTPGNRTEKRASPPGSRQKTAPPPYDDDEADDDEVLEEEPPQPKRRARQAPSRFHHETHGEQRRRKKLPPRQQQYASGEESGHDSDDASSDASEPRVHKRRREAVAGHRVFKALPLPASQRPGVSQRQHGGGGGGASRKTMFSTMSAHTQTDLEDGDDVPRGTYPRKLVGGSEPQRGRAATSSASLLKYKGGGVRKGTTATSPLDKKRKAARGAPPGKKRGASSALNLFGNTDPYAFAASPI